MLTGSGIDIVHANASTRRIAAWWMLPSPITTGASRFTAAVLLIIEETRTASTATTPSTANDGRPSVGIRSPTQVESPA